MAIYRIDDNNPQNNGYVNEYHIDIVEESTAATRNGLRELKDRTGLSLKDAKRGVRVTPDNMLDYAIKDGKKANSYDLKKYKDLAKETYGKDYDKFTDNEKDAGAVANKAVNKKLTGMLLAEKIRRAKNKEKK